MTPEARNIINKVKKIIAMEESSDNIFSNGYIEERLVQMEKANGVR